MMRFLGFLLSSALGAEALYIVTHIYSDAECTDKNNTATTKWNQDRPKQELESGACVKTDVVGGDAPPTPPRQYSDRYTCDSAGAKSHKVEHFSNDMTCDSLTRDKVETHECRAWEYNPDLLKAVGKEAGTVWTMESCDATAAPGSGASAASTFAAFPGVAVVMAFLAIAA